MCWSACGLCSCMRLSACPCSHLVQAVQQQCLQSGVTPFISTASHVLQERPHRVSSWQGYIRQQTAEESPGRQGAQRRPITRVCCRTHVVMKAPSSASELQSHLSNNRRDMSRARSSLHGSNKQWRKFACEVLCQCLHGKKPRSWG